MYMCEQGLIMSNSLACTSSLQDSHRSRGLAVSAVNLWSSHELILSGEESSDMKQISGTLGTDCAPVTSAESVVKLSNVRWRFSRRCVSSSPWDSPWDTITEKYIAFTQQLCLQHNCYYNLLPYTCLSIQLRHHSEILLQNLCTRISQVTQQDCLFQTFNYWTQSHTEQIPSVTLFSHLRGQKKTLKTNEKVLG